MKSITRRRRFRNASAPRRFHRPLLEQLEARLLMASDWQNPRNIRDTSDDGIVTAMDVLQVINELNEPRFHGADLQFVAQFAGSVSNDLMGVAALEYQIHGGPFQPVSFDRDGGFTIDGNEENIPAGRPLLTFRATDARQNAGASAPRHFTFDVQPPTLELDDDSSRLTNGNVRITGRLTDDFAGPESLLAQVDLQDVVAVTITANCSFVFNSTLPSDGTAETCLASR